MKRWLIERGGLVVLAVLIAYALLAPGHIVDGDDAEFSTLGAIGGGAHPSGYPVYLLWLRALSWLPGSAAHAAALATVILAAAQMLVLHAACRAWKASATAATFAVAIYAAGPFVMRMHTEAEVFALNGLVVATVLWLAAEDGPLRGVRRAAALGLVAGLGLGNHLTCVLVAPVGLLGVVRGVRESSPRAIAATLGGLVLGLLPYLYLFATPENLLSWPQPQSFGDLLAIFLRRDYGMMSVGVADGGGGGTGGARLVLLFATLGRSWLYLPALGGLAALAWRCARREIQWWALAATIFLAGVVLTLLFDAAPVGFGKFVVQRYQLLAVMLLAIPVAVAFDWLAARISVRRPAAEAGLAVVVFGALAMASLPHLQREHSRVLEAADRNLLASLPPDAVVIGAGDDLHVGTRYLQLALGLRPDVIYIHAAGMGTGWYRRRIEALGLPIADAKSIRDVADAVLKTKRPLFVDRSQVAILRALPSYPYGLVLRVLPAGTALPTLGELVTTNRALYQAFDLDYPRPDEEDLFGAIEHQRYAATWWDLANALHGAKQDADAEAAAELAQQLEPEGAIPHRDGNVSR